MVLSNGIGIPLEERHEESLTHWFHDSAILAEPHFEICLDEDEIFVLLSHICPESQEHVLISLSSGPAVP
jgi:hypothetical protein